MKRIALAYSGSFETTVAIPWLSETCGAEVVTLTLDLGQGPDLATIRERALAAGAVRAHVLDAREELVRNQMLPAARSGAFSADREYPGHALSRPLIAKHLVQLARMESTPAVAHGCACQGADRSLLEREIHAADASISIMVPRCEWSMTDDQLMEFARARGITVPTGAPESTVDANVWGRVIRDSTAAGSYRLTRPVSESPDTAAFLTIEFEEGTPVRANGVDMPLIEMIESIETIAGTHGVGRIPGPDGARAESPAAVVLDAAYDALKVPGTRPDSVGAKHPIVRVKLFKGSCEATALETVA
jgi:argininosuccinate synthase